MDAEQTAELDRIERELADVEIALARLDAGTYWTCELTGAAIPDELLAADPLLRRIPTDPAEPAAMSPAAPTTPATRTPPV